MHRLSAWQFVEPSPVQDHWQTFFYAGGSGLRLLRAGDVEDVGFPSTRRERIKSCLHHGIDIEGGLQFLRNREL